MYWSEKHSVCQWGIKCAWQSIQEPAGYSVAIDISACHVWILFPFLQSTVTTYCDFPVKLHSLLGSNGCSCIQVLFICKKKKKVFMFVLTSEVSFTTDKMLVETSVLVASALWVCGSRVLWLPQWCLLYLPLVLLSFGTFLWHSSFLSSETFESLAMASWSDIPVYLFCRVHWVHWTLVPGRVRVEWRNL